MKIKMLIDVNKEGLKYNEGESYNVDSVDANKWVSRGWAKKEEKGKKETKEFKIKKDSK